MASARDIMTTIGMVSHADLARAWAPKKVGKLVGAISQD